MQSIVKLLIIKTNFYLIQDSPIATSYLRVRVDNVLQVQAKNKVYTINDDVIRYILEVPPTKSTPIMQHLEKKAHPLIFHNVLKVPVQIFGTAGMLFTF